MSKKISQHDLDYLTEVVKEIKDLIEDNNQNIKDCNRVLNEINSVLNPKKSSAFKSLISKLLNKQN